jgi:hypothetical protein
MVQRDARMRSVAYTALTGMHRDFYQELKQRFVSLPEPYGTRGWAVDLRDPFHPKAECYPTWAEADAACEQRIQALLIEQMAAQEKIT